MRQWAPSNKLAPFIHFRQYDWKPEPNDLEVSPTTTHGVKLQASRFGSECSAHFPSVVLQAL